MTLLANLTTQAMGKIESFDRTFISDSQITELLELGFYPGASVQCLSILPSLDKMILLLGANKVALRLSDCYHIKITENAK